jgi:histidinol-phosphate aminotransferase
MAASRATPALDLAALVGRRIEELEEYAPEPVEEVARRLGMPVGQLIKLDANENPYGPTRRTMALLNGFSEYHRYPDAVSRRLRQAIGEHLGVAPARIVVGNGSDELIDLIMRLFRPSPMGGGIAQVIDCPPTFSMYSFYGISHDLRVRHVPRLDSFRVDLPAIEAMCARDPQPRLLFVASPNNPDGQLLSDAEFERLIRLPVVLVLDEAYVEFAGSSRVGLTVKYGNLIVLRTFSKWAGLAGLRVGYGIFPEALLPALWRLKSPYNVNALAQAAALSTLEDMAEAKATVERIVAERERLTAKLRGLAFLRVFDSQANFILCRVRNISINTVRRAVERRGIMLRYFSGDMQDYVRITVGTPMQNESLLVALRSV